MPDIKIIVAKNGIEHMGEPIPIHATKIALSEQGQCKAINAAVATTNTEWIFVTNDDMIYPPGWWEELTGWANNLYFDGGGSEEIRCISPLLVEPQAGSPTFEVYFCGGAGGDFNKQKFVVYAENRPTPVVPSIRTGFNLPFLIKRELWDTIGGYDVNYDPWGSNGDSDLQYKIMLAGVQPYQNTNCAVYHFSQTSGTFHPDQRGYWDKNWHYFIEKWGFERASQQDGIWQATQPIPAPPIRKFTPWWENFYGAKQ